MSPSRQSVKFAGQRAVADPAQEQGLVNFCPETRYKPRYDAAFRAEALRLASESRSTLAVSPRPEYRPQAALRVAENGLTALARRPGGGGRGSGAARSQ